MYKENGEIWWQRLGITPVITEGERVLMSGTEEDWFAAQEAMDARRLIQTRDPEAVEIGQARLRTLLGREHPGDFDLFD